MGLGAAESNNPTKVGTLYTVFRPQWMDDRKNDISELLQKLSSLDAEFERQMRARGFDPEQAENIALPSTLATLYAERERTRAQLEELAGGNND